MSSSSSSESSRTLRTVGWVSVIVAAELAAFSLLQRSVGTDVRPSVKALHVAGAMALFGLVVPLAFRETLRGGSNMAVSNLYWIILSQLGTVALGYVAFGQKLLAHEWIAFALLAASAGVAFLSPGSSHRAAHKQH